MKVLVDPLEWVREVEKVEKERTLKMRIGGERIEREVTESQRDQIVPLLGQHEEFYP